MSEWQKEWEDKQAAIKLLEQSHDHQVLGNSGIMYSDIPREVWEHVPSAYKRLVERDK